MTMQDCIEQRKTTLTEAVRAALEALMERPLPAGAWSWTSSR